MNLNNNNLQKTLIIVKPDAMERNLSGKVITFFTDNGLFLTQAKTFIFSKDLAEQFYDIHKQKPFFQELVNYITSGLCMAFVLEANFAISRSREIIGTADPSLSPPGTVRAAFGKDLTRNSVHGSDSVENAYREINLIFS